MESQIDTPKQILIHFSPKFYFYSPLKRQETFDFLMFSGSIEWRMELKWVKNDFKNH